MPKRKRVTHKKLRFTPNKKNAPIAMDTVNSRDADIMPIYRPRLRFLPDSQKVTLRYGQRFDLVSGAGLAATQIFSANGLYDPDTSGTGHQPRGFDQLMTMYDHFNVIGAKITIMTAQPSTSGFIGIALSDNNVPTSDVEDRLETLPDNSVIGVLAASGDPLALSLGFSQKKFFSIPGLDDKYQGSTGGNPSDGAFFHVWATALGGATSISLGFAVVIDYITVFTEPKNPNKS